jgi:hypothetical protein
MRRRVPDHCVAAAALRDANASPSCARAYLLALMSRKPHSGNVRGQFKSRAVVAWADGPTLKLPSSTVLLQY